MHQQDPAGDAGEPSPAPVFQFDECHCYFATTLPAHSATVVDAPTTEHVTGEVARLLRALDGELCRVELQERVGIRHEDHFRDAYLVPALQAGLVEMTVPDRPRSSTQRYRLTAAGRAWRAADAREARDGR